MTNHDHTNATAHFSDSLREFADIELFADTHDWLMVDNPYRRPLRTEPLKHLSFNQPMTRDQKLNYTSMAANRVLLTIYETDFVFLPEAGFAAKQRDYQTFYGPQVATLGGQLRPRLE